MHLKSLEVCVCECVVTRERSGMPPIWGLAGGGWGGAESEQTLTPPRLILLGSAARRARGEITLSPGGHYLCADA